MKGQGIVLKSLWMMSLVIMLFVFSTFAWFSDEVTNENNRIQAGNLKIKLEAASSLDGPYRDLSVSSEPVFDFGPMTEPGVEPVVAYIRITNIGSLSLRYRLMFDVKAQGLEEAVVFTIDHIGTENPQTTINGAVLATTFLDNEAMIPEAVDVYRIEMRLDADNTFNIDTDDPRFPLSFVFDIKLHAWQIGGPNPFDPALRLLPAYKEEDLR